MTDGPLSPRNKRVTAARRLLKRSFRTQDRAFLVEGPQAVREALSAAAARPELVRRLYVTGDAGSRHPELLASARAQNIEVDLIGAEVLVELTQTVTPQGVVAVCGFLDVSLEVLLGTTAEASFDAGDETGSGAAVEPTDDLAGRSRMPSLVAFLAHVRDPGNAGTVLRVADAAGAGGVALSEASVDPYNGKCVRASAGSLFHLPLVIGVPIEKGIAAMRAAGLRVVATDGAGERDLDDEIDSGSLAVPTAWVFGNEAWGLPDSTLALCDAVVRVPIHGRAESLNLATAAAVCLYASARALR